MTTVFFEEIGNYAGEYYGVGLDLGRISAGQMEAIKARLESTKAKLTSGDYEGLTKDDVLGELLHTTAISYYAELDMMDYIQGRTMGVNALRLPSENLFSLALNVGEFFGVPVSASSGGLAMDVDRNIKAMKALDGDTAKKVRFALASGMNSSALEHSVPEQLFSTAENPAQGISAVKALQLANDQGIPIYTINQTNIDYVLPQLQVDYDVVVDIQNAVNAGKQVTVSKTNISFNGWNGCGYIVVNPSTGAGAYMISGGMSGGYAIAGIAILFFLLSIMVATVAVGCLPCIAVAIGFFVLALTALYYEVAYLYGIEKANEFLQCLLKLFVGHEIIEFLIERVSSVLLGNLFTLAALTVTMGIEYPHCMEALSE